MVKEYPFALETPFVPAVHPAITDSMSTSWFLFRAKELLIHVTKKGVPRLCNMSPDHLKIKPVFTRYLGKYKDTNYCVAELPESAPPPASMEFRSLRRLFGIIEEDIFTLAGRAIQILQWHNEYRFCGKCGTAMIDRKIELAKECPSCNFISFPRLSPAVIMSVIKKDQILLARSPQFPRGKYSTLAGFVEPGETLEEAVEREVLEESSIHIDNISYVASQPWPFPHSLMIGFSATYASGTIRIDNKEIEDAAWFSADNLPKLPSKSSIARLLIDNFITHCSR